MADDINQPVEDVTQIDEFKEKYLRALADYQNLERQTQAWKDSYSAYATADLIKKLLEILDDLDKAQTHINDEGLKLVVEKLIGILKAEGLEELDLLGAVFDPNLAEVVSTEQGKKDNVIVKILQKGYILKEKVIRPAKVVVSTVN